MSNNRLDELEQRINDLEQTNPAAKVKAACTRREFVYGGILGAAGMAAMTGTASAQSFSEDFQGMALLIGADGDKPAPNGGFFDRKTRYNYVYFAEDTATLYTLRTGDGSWQTFADIMQSPATSSDPGLAFDTWREPSQTPTFVSLTVQLQPGTAAEATVEIDVDEDGGTTADYSFELSAGGSLSGDRSRSQSLLIPDGGSYQIRNVDDPNGANSIATHREQLL